jgi:hypothetical protein
LVIDSGTTGRVVEINWRTTRLLARDQIHLLLPHARLAQQRLTNYSAPRQGAELRLISDNTTFMFGVFSALMYMRKPSDTCVDVHDGAASQHHVN